LSFYNTNQLQGKAGVFSTITVGAFSLDIHSQAYGNSMEQARVTSWCPSPPGQTRMMYDGTPPLADEPASGLLFWGPGKSRLGAARRWSQENTAGVIDKKL